MNNVEDPGVDTSYTSSRFVVDLLTTLRAEKFRLTAWWHFLRCSWNMSCATARNNPGLYRSWAYTTIGIAALASCLFAITIVGEGFSAALRLLPGLVFCVGWQLCDLFWHLGLNRVMYTDELRQHIGLANTVTLLRGLCSAYLLARILAGLATPDNVILIVFVFGCMTDLLDGMIARSTGTCSKLGQLLDSEIDFTFYLLVSIVLLQSGLLPLWLCAVLWLRFCLPLCAALGHYFLLARPLCISSTIWGKCAGLCLAFYILVLLAPSGFSFVTQPLRIPLLVAVIALFVAALVAQAPKAWKGFWILSSWKKAKGEIMYYLAQVNIARMLAPLDDPIVAEFVANLDRVNALADRSPGFIWRCQTEEGNATALRPYEDDRILFNMSVWASLKDYSDFVYSMESLHRHVMKQRRRWFERFDGPYMALWWVPAGHIPTVEEAKARLESLREHGPTPYAFSLKEPFPTPDAQNETPTPILDECPA
jgi:phosphatidylglycerophosphate synthase